ncbi:MAG: hypothetical protein ACK5HO_07270 [Pseudomonadota bacterium]
MSATAIAPSSQYQLAFLTMLDDFDKHDPSNTDFYAPARVDFSNYVQGLRDEELGVRLKKASFPARIAG